MAVCDVRRKTLPDGSASAGFGVISYPRYTRHGFLFVGRPPRKKNGLIKRTWTFRHTFSRPNSGPSDVHPVYSALNRRLIRRHSSFLIVRPSPSRPQCIAHITVTRAMSNSIDPSVTTCCGRSGCNHPPDTHPSESFRHIESCFMFCSPTMPGNPCPEIFIDGGSALYCDFCVRCLEWR